MAKKRKAPAPPSNPTPPPEQPVQPEPEPVDEAQLQIEQQQQQEQYQLEIKQETEAEAASADDEDPDMDEAQSEEEEEEDEEQQQSEEEQQQQQNPTEVTNNGENNNNEEEEEEEDEPEPEFEDDEPVEKLLEPFGKDQLVLLIKEAVSKHPDLIKSVHALADADPAHRKIFVHGLGWDTTAETLTSEFSKYGEIEDCKAVVDKVSGKSKGYAFILFKHRVGARKALVQPQKKIGNRVTSCQLASAGPVPAPPPVAPPVSEYTQRKIFVSNVAAELDPGKLMEYFSQYGEIEEGPLGLDKQTGRPKGFCLFVYRSIESAKKALEEPHKVFEGVTLHCYKAVDGPKPGKQPFHQGPSPHHHHQHGGSQFHPNKKFKGKYPPRGGAAGPPGGHMMGPGGHGGGYNPATAALAPVLGQALTLLASQGGGMGINNLLGGLGGGNQGGMLPNQQGGYGAQPGGYGVQPGMQGGYQNPQMGPGAGRPPMGGAPYMGHGH